MNSTGKAARPSAAVLVLFAYYASYPYSLFQCIELVSRYWK